jgi:hypothetical protein
MSAATLASRSLDKGGSAGIVDVTVSPISSSELETSGDKFLNVFVDNHCAKNY